MPKTRARTGFTPKLIAVAVAACFATDAALANPTGPAVVNGTASFQQAGNLLQVTNSPNAILNWQSFSIGASEITRFLQQSASSAVLNRVIAQNPSSILGALQSNGRVFLINPNGILFGAGAQIDVAGLVASTLNLSNADFLAGKLKFTEVPGAGSVINQGTINAGTGGQVYLVGPSVTNSGVITSPNGEVILAAGNSVELVNPGTPNLRVEISAPDNQAINLGQIVADSGRVGIYAGLINHSGTIRADSAVATDSGRIVLKATKNATLEAGSVITANGPNGGSVTVQSGDTTLVAGTIEAKGSDGAGGTVQVLGNLVGLTGSASVDVSGETGGGTVLVGGDFQGKNPEVQSAFRTYVGSNTIITADAVVSGDGGKVIVWSDDATRFYGNISARGGADGGNGGFVEVSGKNYLDYQGLANLIAPGGQVGTLLLDPKSLDVNDTGGVAYNNDVNNLFANNPTGISTILATGAGSISAQVANVVLQANNDITFTSAVNIANAGTALTAQAGRSILVNNNITTNNGAVSLTANETLANGVVNAQRDPGAAVITMAAGTTINAGNANISITLSDGAGLTNSTSGNITIANLTTTGQALIRNLGPSFGSGIAQQPDSVITADKLLAVANNGSVVLDNFTLPASAHLVNTLAGSARGEFKFKNGQSLEIGTVALVNGITVVGASPATIDINVTSGGLTVNKNITATGGSSGEATITLTAQSGSINVATPVSLSQTLIEAIGGPVGEGGGFATVTLDASNSILVDNATISTQGGSGGGAATVNLTAGTTIEVKNSSLIQAIGGDGIQGGGQATVTLDAGTTITVDGSMIQAIAGFATCGDCPPGVGGNATVRLIGPGGITVQNGSTVEAIGGNGFDSLGFGSGRGGNALVELCAGTFSVSCTPSGGITVNNSLVRAQGGDGGSFGGDGGNASVQLTAAGNISLASTVEAIGGSGSPQGTAIVVVKSTGTGGNITSSANINADGAEGSVGGFTGSIVLSATNGFIRDGTPGTGGGTLKVLNNSNPGAIKLTAKNGIGEIGNPVRIFNEQPDVFALNGTFPSMGTGDIVLAVVNGNLTINDLLDIRNFNPTGTYDFAALGGNLILNTAFMPDSSPLAPTQSVTLRAPAGNVILTGGTTGSIAAGATGSVTLEASNLLDLQAGTSVSGGNVLLKADNMNIFGTVTTTPGFTTILPFTPTRPIKLGPTLQSTSELMLSNAEFNNIIAGTLKVGDVNSGNMTVSAAITPSGSNALSLETGGDLNIDANLTASGSLTLSARSHVKVNSALASATGAVNVNNTSFLDIIAGAGPAQLKAGTNLSVSVGEIMLQGGSGTGAFAELRGGPGTFNVTTTATPTNSGDVLINGGSGMDAFARIFGNPDVGSLLAPMSVGGVIQMNAGTGSGAFARIESASPTSIRVTFPNLGSGGFFVNGQGVVSSGTSGFFAGGQAATLGQNLIVTYGGTTTIAPPTPPNLIDQVVVANNMNIDILSDQLRGGEAGEGTPVEELPVCR